MKNYKIVLQYEGTRFQGWQRQESTDNTIQGKLEAILTKMTGKKTEIDGSGRTDSGVHAMGQIANFHIDVQMTPQQIMDYINTYLPEDIGVISIEEVPERFHSRLNAVGKTYVYRVMNTSLPHVFDRKFVYVVPDVLNIQEMKKAASYLLGTHDFKSFTSTKRGKKSTVRTIEKIDIETIGDEVRLTFSGDGFLYHMVRILTGTLLEVGTGIRKAEDIPGVMDSKNRENAGYLVPGKGLCLIEVRY